MFRSPFRLLAFLSLPLATTSIVSAAEKAPIELRPVLVDAGRLGTGDVGVVDLEIESSIDVPDARIVIAIPPALRVTSPRVRVSQSLVAGQPFHVFASIAIAEPGEHTLRCGVRAAGISRRIDLNVLVGESGVLEATTAPWEQIRFRRATTQREREALLEARVAPIDLAPEDRPRPDPALDALMAELTGDVGEGDQPQRLDAVARYVDVRGSISYRDSSGGLHPFRYVLTQVVDVDTPSPDQVLATTATKSDGSFFAHVWVPANVDPTGDVDLKVKFFSEITSGKMARVTIDGTNDWVASSTTIVDFAGTSYDFGPLAFAAPVSGSANDDVGSRVFSVVDCMLQVGAETFFLRSHASLPQITVIYPVSGSVSFYCDPVAVAPDCLGGTCAAPTVNILRQDALDWDVMAHEWSHYLANRGASHHSASSCGGSHSSETSTIPENGKDKGTRLAWSEGIATFLAMAMLEKQSIALPAIPNAGGLTYDDTEDSTIVRNLESATLPDATVPGLGYANEASVYRTLWDLHDNAPDVSPDSLARDGTRATLAKLWELMTRADNDTLPKFWEFLERRSPSVSTTLTLGSVFAMNNVGPELTSPADDAILSSSIPPQFRWQANGDPTAGFQNNAFTLLVTRNDWATYRIFDAGAGTSFTPPIDEWRSVFDGADASTRFQWAILGRNTAAPATPAGLGLFGSNFPSNAHRFRARSIEIRLTWSPVGADVDLHLRPSSGFGTSGYNYPDDCAYYNRAPDWGVPGDSSDDPVLDRDCTTTCAEENITTGSLYDPGGYRVIVHYYGAHGLGAATATVELREFGQLVRTATATLHNTGGAADGDVWTAFPIAPNAIVDGSDANGGADVTRGADPRYPEPPKR
ncbi:MAG: hypothetical protein HYR85_14540 [Planctomycetes bacterium]|nr:hypothetical protein [Planctomycetota bacterium]